MKNRGIPKTDEHKRHISDNHHDVSGVNNPMYGKTHSEETIRKMRGPKSEKHKQKIKLSALKKVTEGRDNFSGRVSVFNIETKKGEVISKDEFKNNREKYVGNRSKIRKEILNATA